MSDQIKGFIDRILRLKTEQDDLTTDIRGIYLEVQQAGFDKTDLGKAVAIIRRKAKAKDFDVHEARVQEYLAAYEQPSRTHARARATEPEAPKSRPEFLIRKPQQVAA